MTWLEAGFVLLAGCWAGLINTVVGSGTLITFPTLLAIGIPPVSANISNGLGLIPGSVSGAIGYRRELAGQKGRVLRLASGTVIGAAVGAVLLLVLPASAFEAVVPLLIGLAVVLVLLQPRISRWVQARHAHLGGVPEHGAGWLWPVVSLIGVYCGYFGAAQGVMLMAALGSGIDDDLQRLNGVKNILGGIGLGVSSVIFLLVAFDQIDWLVVLLIAIGSTIGGVLGAAVGRRLSPTVLRWVIAVVGTAALVSFFL